ncbi:hypothetical protein [Cereibacter sphaeroides]|uniref:hypothetical protein n=1 Tax=Cereibacter sphaeroides TaxID=1063 RepID=UPI001F1990A5|nr:hypothetical protein [Cereibacter sphaeroides]MCE6967135.1 hypothetical protein [Cereibacter sphaeroides]
MDITVIGGAPGAGKTRALLDQIAATPDRHILACPRIDLIRERVRDLHRACITAGTEPFIEEVHSESGGRLPVLQQLRTRMSALADLPHAVLVITQDTLMMLTAEDIAGWGIGIDEQVAGIIGNRHVIPAAVRMLRDSYDIVPCSRPGWGRLVPKPGCITLGEAMADTSARKLVDLIKWAASPQGVLVDVARWDDIDGSKRPLGWVSIWTYERLHRAKSVTIAAASLEHTLTYKATRQLQPQVNFAFRTVGVTRTQLPTVILHYFAAAHRGSSYFWIPAKLGEPALPGEACITAVLDVLAAREIGYWATNSVLEQRFSGRVSGDHVSVKVEGSNSLQHHTSCALIYSGKARFEDEPIMAYFGWTKAAIERARECEDMLQFVQRGIIRCAGFGGLYHVYVYDQWQAEWLAAYFKSNGIVVELVPEETAGIMEVERAKSGRKPDQTRTREQKAEDRRARDRERKRRTRQAKRNMGAGIAAE